MTYDDIDLPKDFTDLFKDLSYRPCPLCNDKGVNEETGKECIDCRKTVEEFPFTIKRKVLKGRLRNRRWV